MSSHSSRAAKASAKAARTAAQATASPGGGGGGGGGAPGDGAAAAAAAAAVPPPPPPAATARPSRPMVQIVNGQITVISESLELQSSRPAGLAEQHLEEVVEAPSVLKATYSSFTGRAHTERWGDAETRRFYLALRECGTDFTTMLPRFPGRTQRQLKNKFRKESRENAELVSLALDPKNSAAIDMLPYEASLLATAPTAEPAAEPATDAAQAAVPDADTAEPAARRRARGRGAGRRRGSAARATGRGQRRLRDMDGRRRRRQRCRGLPRRRRRRRGRRRCTVAV